MEILLLQDVKKLGSEGELVRVRSGYARNYLFPKSLAVPATAENRRSFEEAKRQQAQKLLRIKSRAEALKRKLESRSLTLKLSLGEDDKPFGSITVYDIVEALQQEGFRIEKQAVELEHPIKTLGIYDISIKLHPELSATMKVWVVKA